MTTKPISKCVSVDVNIDVDLDDFETEDLIDELQSRNINVVGDGSPLHAIADAFRLGRDALATELARAMCCDQLGVIL
jgi:hypothetical protein